MIERPISADADTAETQVSTNSAEANQDVTNLARGATVGIVGKLGGRGIHGVGQVFLARLLGPELFGLYALGWTILRLIGSFGALGLDRGIVRFGAGHWPSNKAAFRRVFLQSLSLAFLTGVGIGALIFISAPWLESVFSQPGLANVLRIFAFGYPFLACMNVLVATTRISKRVQYSVYAEDIGQAASNIVLVILFIALGYGLQGAVFAGVLSFAVATTMGCYYVYRLFPGMGTATASDVEPSAENPTEVVSSFNLLAFSVPTALTGVFSMLIVWVDRLFLGFLRPAADVGVYQAVTQFAILFSITLRGMNMIFTPMIAEFHARGEKQRLDNLYKISTKWVLYIGTPMFLIICFAAQELLGIVFGSAYTVGATALIILSIGQFVNISTGSVGFVLVMTGWERYWMIISVVAFVLNVTANWLLIPQWGINGAAVATTLSTALLYWGGLIFVRWRVGIWPYDHRYVKGLVATLATVIALLALQLLPIESQFIKLLLTVTVTLVVFGGIIWRAGLDAEDLEMLQWAKHRMRKQKV